MTNNLLLGFDCKFVSGEPLLEWDQKRRDHFLLRSDIAGAGPISVDDDVCRSIFNFNEAANKYAGVIRLSPEDWHQQSLQIWRNYEAMSCVLTENAVGDDCIVIAIRLCHENWELDEYWQSLAKEKVTPSDLDGSWMSIGFDIADRFLTSALSNCSYASEFTEEKSQAINIWSNDINELGLINSYAQAVAFRSHSDSRIAGHAPFHVLEILKKQTE